MSATVKAIIGALLTGLLAWLTYGAACKPSDGAIAAEGTGSSAVTAEPASKEAVAGCQADLDTLMKSKSINFQSGSAYLAAESGAVLDEVANALKPCAGTNIEIQGHTDLRGSADVNVQLSQSRAETVQKALTERGVAAERMSAKGYGFTQPIVNEKNPEADAKNRRTVFVVSAAAANAGE